MDHKFKGRWRSYVFMDDEWKFQGHMDLSTMGEDGHIDDGVHPTPGILLQGDAIANALLRLNTVPPGISYVGVLTHEVGVRMTITGVEHFGFADAEARERFLKSSEGVGELSQDDPPWVITKP